MGAAVAVRKYYCRMFAWGYGDEGFSVQLVAVADAPYYLHTVRGVRWRRSHLAEQLLNLFLGHISERIAVTGLAVCNGGC